MAAASTTDVRAWARENGYDVQARGPLSDDVRRDYDAAHAPGIVQGVLIDDGAPSDADFTAAGSDDYPAAPAPGPRPSAADMPGAGPAAPPSERRPRQVRRGSNSSGGRTGFLRGLFGGDSTRPKAKHSKHPRVPLGDFAEETWTDLAWLAAPLPPLAKILTVQAPYAGVVVDETVAGTPADAVLQPFARYGQAFRALNGLIGPPVFTLLICAQGQYLTNDQGQLIVDQTGRPVWDQRTALMFGGLRYSLLQMAKVSEMSAAQISERTEAMDARMKIVDAIIESVFPPPPQLSAPPAPAGAPQNGGPGPEHTFAYPDPDATRMTDVGSDPGRMG